MASEWAREKVEQIVKLAECIHADDCGEPYGEGPCTCWVEEVWQEIAAALDEARREGAEERLMQVIASLTDLGLRPEDGGPVYYATHEFGGEVKTVALQPRQIQPVFNALRRAVGGYEKLQEWRRRVEAEAEQRGAERERWECYRMISGYLHSFGCTGMSADQVSTAVALKHRIFERGPMRGPEEE